MEPYAQELSCHRPERVEILDRPGVQRPVVQLIDSVRRRSRTKPANCAMALVRATAGSGVQSTSRSVSIGTILLMCASEPIRGMLGLPHGYTGRV